MQELEDGKLDELFIHMPPRVGKLISDDTPVFTSKGWKKHGDLKVGDLVVGLDGRYVSAFSDKYDEEANVVVTNTGWI